MEKFEIINITKSAVPQNITYEVGCHSFREFIYVVSGKCMFKTLDSSILVSKGSGIAFNELSNQVLSLNGSLDCVVMCFQYKSESSFSVPSLVYLDNAEFVNLGINSVKHYSADKSFEFFSNQLIENEISRLEILAEREYTLSHNANSDRVLFNKITTYIVDNFFEECKFEEVSKKFGISSRYLRKLFHSELGMSPVVYLGNIRIDMAKKFLATTSNNVSDIAGDVGFNSVQYFSKLFKKMTGISPSDFRLINQH